MMGASQSALSIQKPSQSGPRTHGEGDVADANFALGISPKAADEACAVIGQSRFSRY
jgi:hypothetical protein